MTALEHGLFAIEEVVYKRIKPKLVEEGRRGEFVVIKGEMILGTFPDFTQAYAAGCMKLGNVPMLVREIGGEDCPRCGAEYENVGHPLKPGVIMMKTCKCTLAAQRPFLVTDDWEKKAAAILEVLGLSAGSSVVRHDHMLPYEDAVRLVAGELRKAFADGLAGAPRTKQVERTASGSEPHAGSFIGTDGKLHKGGRIE
jgi:hypothetical protein